MQHAAPSTQARPLNDSYVRMLSAAMDLCLGLLRYERKQSEQSRALKRASHDARIELYDLEILRGELERVLALGPGATEAAGSVAAELRRVAHGHIDRAREMLARTREQLEQRAGGSDPAPVLAALQSFLTCHQLPGTTWALSWCAGDANQPPRALAYALTPRGGLAATLRVDVPPSNIWARPVKVALLDRHLAVRMARKRWWGRLQIRVEQLSSYYITRVAHTPLCEAVWLSKRGSSSSPGLRITLREGEDDRVSMVFVDQAGRPVSDAVTLTGSDRVMVQRFWLQVQQAIGELRSHRRALELATINGTPVGQLGRFHVLAQALISALAPSVRAARLSYVSQPNQHGGPDALRVRFEQILRRCRSLPHAKQAMFAAFELWETDWEQPPAAGDAPRTDAIPPPAELAPTTPPPAIPPPAAVPAPVVALPLPRTPPSAPAWDPPHSWEGIPSSAVVEPPPPAAASWESDVPAAQASYDAHAHQVQVRRSGIRGVAPSVAQDSAPEPPPSARDLQPTRQLPAVSRDAAAALVGR